MNWQGGYIHEARLRCTSCRGRGTIQGHPCGACDASGWRLVGCGGPAERDLNHGTLANCIAEDRMISPEELSQV